MDELNQTQFCFDAVSLSNCGDSANTPLLGKNDELLELDSSFSFDNFQVVRREFFAHINEPSIIFNNYKFYVNKACLNKFPNAQYVQVLIDRQSKILALRPCQEQARDSFMWCRISNGKREPKPTTCKLFCAKVATMMNWNPMFRYKVLGKLIHANGEYLIAFDLTATEMYKRREKEGDNPKAYKKPLFPEDWKDQFGMTFYEHQQSLKINTFDGYAVYAITHKSKVQSTDK